MRLVSLSDRGRRVVRVRLGTENISPEKGRERNVSLPIGTKTFTDLLNSRLGDSLLVFGSNNASAQVLFSEDFEDTTLAENCAGGQCHD